VAVTNVVNQVERVMGQGSSVEQPITYIQRGTVKAGTETAIYVPTKLKSIKYVNLTPLNADAYTDTVYPDVAIVSHAPSDTDLGEGAVDCVKFVSAGTADKAPEFSYELIGGLY